MGRHVAEIESVQFESPDLERIRRIEPAPITDPRLFDVVVVGERPTLKAPTGGPARQAPVSSTITFAPRPARRPTSSGPSTDPRALVAAPTISAPTIAAPSTFSRTSTSPMTAPVSVVPSETDTLPERGARSSGRRTVALAACAIGLLGAVSAAALVLPDSEASAQGANRLTGTEAGATACGVPTARTQPSPGWRIRHRLKHRSPNAVAADASTPGATPDGTAASTSSTPRPSSSSTPSASSAGASGSSAAPAVVAGGGEGSTSFVSGTTKPSASNTGAGVIRSAPTKVINGNVTLTGNQSLKDTIVHGKVIVRGSGNVVENNIITGPLDSGYTTSTWLVDTRDASGAIVRFNTIRAASTSGNVNGIGLRNVHAERNDISRVIDGFDITPAPGSNSLNTTIKDNYIHDLQFNGNSPGHSATLTPASYTGPWARTPWSHDDAIQVLSGDGLTITGNTIEAKWADDIGTLPLPTVVKQLSALMINSPRGPVTGLVFRDNWVDYGEVAINGIGAAGSGVFADNRFGRHTVGYQMRFATAFSASTTDNTYSDTRATVSIIRS